MQHNLLSLTDGEKVTSKSNEHGYLHMATLLKAFDLHPFFATVILVTNEVFRVCGLVSSESYNIEANFLELDNRYSHIYGRWQDRQRMHQGIAWLRRAVTRSRLRYYRVRSTSTLPVCGDSESLTHSAWIKAVEEIFSTQENAIEKS